MFTTAWLICVSLLILRNDGLPKWLGWLGLVVAFILGNPIVELFGMTGDLFLASVSITTWLMLVGLTLVVTSFRANERASN